MSRLVKALVALSFSVLALILLSQMLPSTSFGKIDLLQYWSASTLFLQKKNPYDISALFELQQTSLSYKEVIVLWNPPSVFPLIFWMPWLSFSLLAEIWFLLAVIAVVVCFTAISTTYRREQKSATVNSHRWALAYLLTFFPIADMLSWGQISWILLIGYSGFIFYFHRSDDSADHFRAGCFLSLCMIKPHLLYLVYAALFLRALLFRSWYLVAGLAMGTIVLFSIPIFYQPQIYQWYFEALQNPPSYIFQTPTISSWMQWLLGTSGWRYYLPALLTATFLAIAAFQRKSLLSHRFILSLVPLSLLTAPYGWGYNHLLLLPVALYLIHFSRHSKHCALIPLLLLVANFCLLMTPLSFGQQYVVWYPAVILALFWFHLRKASCST